MSILNNAVCVKCAAVLQPGFAFCPFCGAVQAPRTRAAKKRGNGQGTVFKLPNGRYRAQITIAYYVDASGKRHRKTLSRDFIKKSDAIAALPSMRIDGAPPEDMTLYALHEEYTASKPYADLSQSQRQKLGYAWKRLEPLHFRGISTLTVADMEQLITASTASYYPAHDMQVMLSHLYTIAVKRELVPANKSRYIDLPYDAPTAKRECWTAQEVASLWQDYASTHDPHTAYALIMCYTGMRPGELYAMRLDCIDLDARRMVGGIKTDAGTDREIPICDAILPILRTVVGIQTAAGKPYLLTEYDTEFYAHYWQMVARANLRELPPYTCRHWYFSMLTAAGIQPGIIAETGGHTSYVTTLKNYVRIPLSDKLAAVNALPGAPSSN